jgi:thiamine biosynthesis lipoprotein
LKNLIKPIIVLIGVIIIAVFIFNRNKTKKHEIFGNTQGTTYSIKYFAENETITQKSIDSILQLFDTELSTYIPTSKISKINQNDTTIIVNNWFKDVYKLSYQVYQESNGLFDPTIGILVNAYGFGPKKVAQMPNELEIKQFLKKVGLNKVNIYANGTITKEYPDMFLDFNAIAQGYAVDVLVNYLKSKKIENAMVEIGGEVFAFGKNLETQKLWSIGIENPTQKNNNREILEKVSLQQSGLATSGNYRKIKTDSITGKKYVHTLNPKTGQSQESNILSATVITTSAALADAYATTFMLMNLNEIKLFIKNKPNIKILIIYQNEQLEIEVFKSF